MFDLHVGCELTDLGLAGDPVYCDGIGRLENLGVNFQTTFFCWMKANGIWLRVPRLHVIRPRSSCLTDGPFAKMLAGMDSPHVGTVISRAH